MTVIWSPVNVKTVKRVFVSLLCLSCCILSFWSLPYSCCTQTNSAWKWEITSPLSYVWFISESELGFRWMICDMSLREDDQPNWLQIRKSERIQDNASSYRTSRPFAGSRLKLWAGASVAVVRVTPTVNLRELFHGNLNLGLCLDLSFSCKKHFDYEAENDLQWLCKVLNFLFDIWFLCSEDFNFFSLQFFLYIYFIEH